MCFTPHRAAAPRNRGAAERRVFGLAPGRFFAPLGFSWFFTGNPAGHETRRGGDSLLKGVPGVAGENQLRKKNGRRRERDGPVEVLVFLSGLTICGFDVRSKAFSSKSVFFGCGVYIFHTWSVWTFSHSLTELQSFGEQGFGWWRPAEAHVCHFSSLMGGLASTY